MLAHPSGRRKTGTPPPNTPPALSGQSAVKNSTTNPKSYLRTLRERASRSKVYERFQMDGIEIAGILGDQGHKSLYIKLAKEHDSHFLRRLAAEVVDRGGRVRNKGAYFMTLLRKSDPNLRIHSNDPNKKSK